MYRTVVTICTAQWSLYVAPVVAVCITQWSLCTASGHYMYRQWSLYVRRSGLCMYRTVVSIFTASSHYMYREWLLYVPPGLTFNSFTFCPHSVFMYFVWIWEQTAIISLYSINWLVFITETECVYCAVRTGYLNLIRVNLTSFTDNAMSRWHFTVKTRLRSLVSPSEICGEHSDTGIAFSPGTSFFPPSLSLLHTHLLCVSRPSRTNQWSLVTQ
jgi:hypothetical protein